MSTPASASRRIAYLGPQGTFTEEALLSEADLAEEELVAMPTIAEAIGAADQGLVEHAFVPIENSIEGSVSATLDQLVFETELLIQREVVLDVHLDLLALPGVPLSGVKRVISFPHATAQIRRYLAAALPGVEVGSTNSTADAARLVAEAGDASLAAVAPPLAAKLYGLEVLAHAIEDHAENSTRFVLLAKGRVPEPTGHDRTAIACFQRANRPGSLLEILARRGAKCRPHASSSHAPPSRRSVSTASSSRARGTSPMCPSGTASPNCTRCSRASSSSVRIRSPVPAPALTAPGPRRPGRERNGSRRCESSSTAGGEAPGGMAERTNAAVLKTVGPQASGVRIPLPPPLCCRGTSWTHEPSGSYLDGFSRGWYFFVGSRVS